LDYLNNTQRKSIKLEEDYIRELKKAKADGKQAKMVRDKLFIEGQEFKLT
jgi:hypothetical protein